MKSTVNDLELILNQLGIDPTTLIPVNITGLTIEELDRISAHVECGKSFVNCYEQLPLNAARFEGVSKRKPKLPF